MRLFAYTCFLLGVLMISIARAQTLTFNSFEIICPECPDYLAANEPFRQGTIQKVEDALREQLKIREFLYPTKEKFTQQKSGLVYLSNKPEVQGDGADYYGNLIMRFTPGATTSTNKYTSVNLNFTAELYVVDHNREKVLKRKIKIPGKIDPFTPFITDLPLSEADFQSLISRSVNDLFHNPDASYQRVLLQPGRSTALQDFINDSDSIIYKQKNRQISVTYQNQELFQLQLQTGSKNQEFTERFFDLDLSDRLRQKISLEDHSLGKEYTLIASVSAEENFDRSLNFGDPDDAMITFYEGDQVVGTFTMLGYDQLIGRWESDTLTIEESVGGPLYYWLNNEKVAISGELTVTENRKKQPIVKLHFLRTLPLTELKKLVYGYIAYGLAYSMEMKSLEDESD